LVKEMTDVKKYTSEPLKAGTSKDGVKIEKITLSKEGIEREP
jgi:hypothetical protein